MKAGVLQKPIGKSWSTAQRYIVDFYEPKYPISGGHLVYVVVGRKWVRVTKGDLVSNDDTRHQLSRFRISINEWNNLIKRKLYNENT